VGPALALAALMVVGCAKTRPRADAQPGDAGTLASAYHLLGLIPTALDFPGRPDILASCQSNGDEGCLRLYRQAREAVALLFHDGSGPALARTLETIEQECGPGKRVSVCRGAAVALYFFRSDSEDQTIVGRLEKASPEVLTGVFSRQSISQWLGYRPAPARWRPLADRAALVAEDRDEVGRWLAGPRLPPYRLPDGTSWPHPAIHMVDPSLR